jgi:phosphopantetheine adenylyltransferase
MADHWNFQGKIFFNNWAGLKKLLTTIFDPTNGHSHNGTDSKALSGGTADDSTLAVADGVFSIKAGGVTATELAANAVETAKIKDAQVTKAKLAAATQSAHIADATANIAAASGDAPTKAEYDALVTAYNDLATKFNTLLVAQEKVNLATS